MPYDSPFYADWRENTSSLRELVISFGGKFNRPIITEPLFLDDFELATKMFEEMVQMMVSRPYSQLGLRDLRLPWFYQLVNQLYVSETDTKFNAQQLDINASEYSRLYAEIIGIGYITSIANRKIFLEKHLKSGKSDRAILDTILVSMIFQIVEIAERDWVRHGENSVLYSLTIRYLETQNPRSESANRLALTWLQNFGQIGKSGTYSNFANSLVSNYFNRINALRELDYQEHRIDTINIGDEWLTVYNATPIEARQKLVKDSLTLLIEMTPSSHSPDLDIPNEAQRLKLIVEQHAWTHFSAIVFETIDRLIEPRKSTGRTSPERLAFEKTTKAYFSELPWVSKYLRFGRDHINRSIYNVNRSLEAVLRI